MTYNNSIPNANDFVLLSQKEMLDNFQQIFKAFNQNHIPFNQDNEGKHTATNLLRQGGAPATASDECALYNLLGTGAQSQLFYRPDSNGVQIQMSYQDVVTTGNDQRSFMAGPFIFFFGFRDNLTPGVAEVITVTPAVTTILTAQAIATSIDYSPGQFPLANFSLSPTAFTTNSFTIVMNAGNAPPKYSIYYLVIGVV